jgi:hypothetical protein
VEGGLGAKAKEQSLPPEEHDGDLSFVVFQREIEMA